jgi:flagellar basal body-associated protein FliL
MSEERRKSKKLIWVKFTVLGLLLASGGFTLTACQVPQLGEKSTEQPGDKNSDEQVKENPATKSYQKKVDKQLKKNQSTNPNKTSDQDEDQDEDEDEDKNKQQDTDVDDDPE